MLTVHHLGVPQSERIVWLCEELNIPYELKIYPRATHQTCAPHEALRPLGTAPIISDGDVVLPESAAIVEYVIAKYGNGRLTVSPEQPNYADYLFWFHFANDSFLPGQMMGVVISSLGVTPLEHPIAALVNQRSETAMKQIDDRLSEALYFAGPELTAADIMMVFALTTLRLFVPRCIGFHPNISAYLQRIAARPAYRRAMVKGDPNPFPNIH